ncbi:MAG: methionine adenosyltransferase [Thaumarchaeota archaeon]|nr:methionine adenosyltransferase [Nitrososphaerota archaeon]
MKFINVIQASPVESQPIEVVERKGIGHPDTIVDNIVDAISVELNKEYIRKFGGILHYNLDKALLAAGSSKPTFGGGIVEKPMLIVFGDRATTSLGEEMVDVDLLAKKVAKNWIKNNIRFLDVDNHVRFQSEIGKSAGNLSDIFKRKSGKFLGANDTSAAVGYAPLTKTERAVLDLERKLNSNDFKKQFPETGEDVKVMAVRIKNKLDVTVSMAFIDRFIDSELSYFRRKSEVMEQIKSYLDDSPFAGNYELHLNNLDVEGRGEDGLYLTVTGTSAESGDSGQVGRGNRVNGLISLARPSGSEAAAGKNPVSHVGKIYNLLSFEIANSIHKEVDEVDEVYVWLVSRIGQPINIPSNIAVQVIPKENSKEDEIVKKVSRILEETLSESYLNAFINRLIEGRITIC